MSIINLPEQKEIFHFPEIRVVEASAGSGKTYALAKRYLQLVLNPQQPLAHMPIRNILAITFTNKAAFEMKTRILELLKLIALKQLDGAREKDILHPIGLDIQQASPKAFLLLDHIIHNYNFFQVQTIDKFINALLSGCAFKIGLTANFRIKTNASEYLEYSLDELIDQMEDNKDVRKLFTQFLHHYLYLENRMGWFPKKDILAIISTLFAVHNTYGLPFLEGGVEPKDIIKRKRAILEQMQALALELPPETDQRFKKGLEAFVKKHENSFDVDNISNYFTRLEPPVKKGGKVTAQLARHWSKLRGHLEQLCVEEATSLFDPYIHVFRQVMREFYAVSFKDDVLFLEELNKRASLLFDEEYVTVEELYYRLATRFHHYLIDEFQDTSRLQWHNLEIMIEEALSTGGSLFYVGDKKQAIYGFRGGDAALFDGVKGTFGSFNVQEETLLKNWRSQKAIIEFNNALFSIDNLERFVRAKEEFEEERKKGNLVIFTEEDLKGMEQMFYTSQQTCRDGLNAGFVNMVFVDDEEREKREESIRAHVIDLIKELQGRFDYQDIAILTRGNYEIEQITNWLLEAGIPVESERTSNVKQHPLIAEWVAFLRFLSTPIDNLAFAQFISGDIFTKAAGLKKADMQQFLFSVRDRLKTERDFYLYTVFREQFREVWDRLIDEFFRNVGLYPLYEFVVSMFHRYDCFHLFPGSQGFFMHFLELVKAQETEHHDAQSFLEFFDTLEGERLYVNVSYSNAVKMMTIHKSKGLEFPVVILPFFGMDVQVGAQGNDQQQSYVLKRDLQTIQLLRIKNKYLDFSESLRAIYDAEYKQSFFSELNNVYVAVTRAQCELYGYIPKKIGNKHNLVRLFVPEAIVSLGRVQSYDKGSKKEKNVTLLAPSQYGDWLRYLQDEFGSYQALQFRGQRVKGEILHYILSMIKNFEESTMEFVLDAAIQKTRDVFFHVDDFTEYRNVILAVLSHKPIQAFFTVPQEQVLTEYEVVDSGGHTKRMDRIVVTPEEVTVIDFKLKKEGTEAYQEQVRAYMKIMRSLYPKQSVKGYLAYLEQPNVEEVYVT